MYHKMHRSHEFLSVSFNKSIHSCNLHPKQNTEHFHCPRKLLCIDILKNKLLLKLIENIIKYIVCIL